MKSCPVPGPAVALVSLPGFCFPYVISSGTLVAVTEGLQTSVDVYVKTLATGKKSLTGSNANDLDIAGIVPWVTELANNRV